MDIWGVLSPQNSVGCEWCRRPLVVGAPFPPQFHWYLQEVKWILFRSSPACIALFHGFPIVSESCMGCGLRPSWGNSRFPQLPRRNPGQEVSRQSWLVAILNFLTSPFPFEHHCPTEIREITHCYNFLGRWVCLSQPDSLPHSKTAHWDRG